MIIKAYDTLNHAIKWQLLSMFIELFIIAMTDLYFITMELLTKKFDVDGTLMVASILTVQLIPMLSVCMSGDRLHKEVLWLREMLACRLYEGKLEKRERRPAQALLTLTEARNLSFSLFHTFNVDISLPFKMFSLLITYLIILLQFEKVKNNLQEKPILLD
ncbi:putative gustatory receptor 28b [Pieris brassicae]|uniref:putative gustatory receptor 28b n=1 Tax=Pieris brassicae TaxID=7116 RepID=UPI001E6618C1|nr:putative gustatory receptor 28b [Pieris brassicae]